MNEKERIVTKLIEMAFLFNHIPKKPGKLIEYLSKEDRDIVKTLTFKDFYCRIKQ